MDNRAASVTLARMFANSSAPSNDKPWHATLRIAALVFVGNTLIALDMIFIDARGEVRHVHSMARPLDETPIPGAAPTDPAPERLMVLEVAGGEAARLGIVPGMALSHPRLPQAGALAPCD